MKRLFSVLLVLLTICSCLAVSSCAKKRGDEERGDDTEVTGELPGADTTAVNEWDEIPASLSFDEREFRFFIGFGGTDRYAPADAEGDKVSNAQFLRNQTVEDRLDVVLTFGGGYGTDGGSMQAATAVINNMVMVDRDDTYQAYIHVQHEGMPGLIQKGCFRDWGDLNYVNFEKSYWYSNCLRDINYGTKVYSMTGDYNIYSLSQVDVLFFNADFFTRQELELPFDDVLDHTWTIGKFKELAVLGNLDMNEDGMERDEDLFGFGGWSWEQIEALFVGMGGTIVSKDANGLPDLNASFATQRNRTVFEKISDLFLTEGCFTDLDGSVEVGWKTMLLEGRLMFAEAFLTNVPIYAKSVEHFGFLPYPTLEEGEEYILEVDYCLDHVTGEYSGAMTHTKTGSNQYTFRQQNVIADPSVTMKLEIAVINYNNSDRKGECTWHFNNFASGENFKSKSSRPEWITTRMNDTGVLSFSAETITAPVGVYGSNIALGENTICRLYVKYTDAQLASDGTVKVSLNGVERVYNSYTDGVLYEDQIYYYSVAVPAKQMTDQIRIEVFDQDGNLIAMQTTSVEEYCIQTINDPASSAELKRVCKTLLEYGAAAQEYWNYKLSDLANKNLTE